MVHYDFPDGWTLCPEMGITRIRSVAAARRAARLFPPQAGHRDVATVRETGVVIRPSGQKTMNAEVIYLFAYDIAQEADLKKIEALMRGAAEQDQVGRLKDAPAGFPVYRPLSIRMDPIAGEGPLGPLTLFPSVKIFAIGAMSVKVRVPVSCKRISDLSVFRDLRFKNGTTLEQRAFEIARQVMENVRPGLSSPVSSLSPPEGYTVFCVNTAAPGEAAEEGRDSEEWLQKHEREVAALLVAESDPGRLSRQEVQDTTKYRYSYYQRDLAVIDWDAALLVDTPADYNDTLYVLEMANLQLEELRTYDRKLDQVLDKAYDDVEFAARPYAFGARQRVLSGLREIKMDIAKVADEISNITKFFGDWHLARIYMGCAARFHLSEWESTVSQKLRTLDSLYTMLQQDGMNRAMLILETAIVALFVIDLVIIVVLGIKE